VIKRKFNLEFVMVTHSVNHGYCPQIGDWVKCFSFVIFYFSACKYSTYLYAFKYNILTRRIPNYSLNGKKDRPKHTTFSRNEEA
jgi:hypothetical protein